MPSRMLPLSAVRRASRSTGFQIASPKSSSVAPVTAMPMNANSGMVVSRPSACPATWSRCVRAKRVKSGMLSDERRPVADHRGEPGHERPRRRSQPAAAPASDQSVRCVEHRAQTAGAGGRPHQQREAGDDQERRRQRLQPLDRLGAVPDEVEVDQPEQRKPRNSGTPWPMKRAPPPISSHAGHTEPEQRADRETADPGLDAEPTARHQRRAAAPADALRARRSWRARTPGTECRSGCRRGRSRSSAAAR